MGGRGRVEFGVPPPGTDTNHGVVVSKVVQDKPVMTVYVTLSGASLKDGAPSAAERTASSAGKGETSASDRSRTAAHGGKPLGACGTEMVKLATKTK